MPLAPAVAAALTTAGAHPYSLEVAGFDILKEPGQTGMGVPLESIEVVEAGPGGVSSMTFTIDDPLKTVTVPDRAEVFFRKNPDVVWFRGYVDASDVNPDFGGQGRSITVQCSGVEIWLDWTIVPSTFTLNGQFSLPNGTGILAQTFAPMLKAPSIQPGMSLAPYTRAGSFTYPIGNFVRPSEPSNALRIVPPSLWTAPGGTLRQAIFDFAAHCGWCDVSANVYLTEGIKGLWTVDYFMGLRAWEDDFSLQPDDYTTLTVTDTYGSSTNAAGLKNAVDYSGVIRQVAVVAGSTDFGTFGDGSGITGRAVLVSDSTIADATGARTRALAVMAESSANSRGSFTLEDYSPADTVHAGSLCTITDAATGLASTYRIMEIRKTWQGDGTQTWDVSFGGLPKPSVTKYMRRLTRDLN